MKNTIQQKILKELEPKLQELGVAQDQVEFKESLLSQGILDSISFLEFMIQLESVFSTDFDFSELDPTEFTSINGLAELIKQQKETPNPS